MVTLTNCTLDGIVYDVQRVMEEALGIKPDLVFPGTKPGSRSQGPPDLPAAHSNGRGRQA